MSEERIDLSRETPHDEYLRHRRRMYRRVMVVVMAGIAAFIALLCWARQREVYSEHYAFRAAVKPGAPADEVIARFGRPYRIFRSPRALEPVLTGRGRYREFDSSDVPEQFDRVLHYRTTLEHGEFVFVDATHTVTAVITGRGDTGGR